MAQPVTDSAATDAAAADSDGAETRKHEAKPPTRLILVRHGGHRAHRSVALGPHARHRSLREGHRAGRGRGRAPRACCRSSTVYASPIERTTQTARYIAARLGLEVQPLPGVIEADYGDWTGGKIVRPRQDRRVEGRAGRAVARGVPRRRVDPRDAVAHGRRARRGRRRAPARDGRGREPRRSDQVGDRALHRHAPRPVPAPAREPGVGHRARLPRLRRAAREVQRHRRPRRPPRPNRKPERSPRRPQS